MTQCSCQCQCPTPVAESGLICGDCRAERHQQPLFTSEAKPVIHVTGYTGQNHASLLPMLIALNAILIDIRFSPGSRHQKWRGAELERLLGERYAQVPALGNQNYNGRLGDDVIIVDIEHGLDQVLRRLSSFKTVVLFCGCPDYDECHRSDVATVLIERGWEILEIEDWGNYLEELTEETG